MTNRFTDGLDERAKDLRKAFDDAFASPSLSPQADWIELLLIQTSGQRLAIRVLELAGVEAGRNVVQIPAVRPGLLGLSAVHGQLVPVYELGFLLGFRSRDSAPRWLALRRDQELLAFAFDELEGSCRIAAREVYARESTTDLSLLSRHAVRIDSHVVPILDMPAVASALRRK